MTPFVLLKNNTFTRNMAYFEGNSVYIRGAQKTENRSEALSSTIGNL